MQRLRNRARRVFQQPLGLSHLQPVEGSQFGPVVEMAEIAGVAVNLVADLHKASHSLFGRTTGPRIVSWKHALNLV